MFTFNPSNSDSIVLDDEGQLPIPLIQQQQQPFPALISKELVDEQPPEILRKPVAVKTRGSQPNCTRYPESASIASSPEGDTECAQMLLPKFSVSHLELKLCPKNSNENETEEKPEKDVKAAASWVIASEPEELPTEESKASEECEIQEATELENLLSLLPVISKQQQVAEFASLQPDNSGPLTEMESETSMIPQASSIATIGTTSRTSSAVAGRPGTEDSTAKEDDNPKAVDTNNMTLSELVTLGRKIYSILSQLSSTMLVTTSKSKSTSLSQKSVNFPSQTVSNGLVTNNNSSILFESTGKCQIKSNMNSMVQMDLKSPSPPEPPFVVGMTIVEKNARAPLEKRSRTLPPVKALPPSRIETSSSLLSPYSPRPSRVPQMQRQGQGRSVSLVLSRPPIARSAARVSERPPSASRSNNNSFIVHDRYTHGGVINTRINRQVSFLEDRISSATITLSDIKPRRNFIQENISRIRRIRRTEPAPKLPKRRSSKVQPKLDSRSRSRERPPGAVYDEFQSNLDSTVATDRTRSASLPPQKRVNKRKSRSPGPSVSPSVPRYYHDPESSRPASRSTVTSKHAQPSSNPSATRASSVHSAKSTSQPAFSLSNAQSKTKATSTFKKRITTFRAGEKLTISSKSLDTQRYSLADVVGQRRGGTSRKSRSKTRRGSATSAESNPILPHSESQEDKTKLETISV